MDPENPVVKLCSEGMRAEYEGRNDDAQSLFNQAWETAKDDYDACVAAHFLARHQDTPQDLLHWNREALIRANAVRDEKVQSFYPTLYLNLGYSYEVLGNSAEASKYYDLAAKRADDLPAGHYGDVVRNGIAEGQKRIRSIEGGNTRRERSIDSEQFPPVPIREDRPFHDPQ
jgi:tetratricopeptide (TPR) repeat protein